MDTADASPNASRSSRVLATKGIGRDMGYLFAFLSAFYLAITICVAITSGEFQTPLYITAGVGILFAILAANRYRVARRTPTRNHEGVNS